MRELLGSGQQRFAHARSVGIAGGSVRPGLLWTTPRRGQAIRGSLVSWRACGCRASTSTSWWAAAGAASCGRRAAGQPGAGRCCAGSPSPTTSRTTIECAGPRRDWSACSTPTSSDCAACCRLTGAVVLVHDHVEGVGLDRLVAEHRCAGRGRGRHARGAAGPGAGRGPCLRARARAGVAVVCPAARRRSADAGRHRRGRLGRRSRPGQPASDDVRDLALACLACLDPAAHDGPLAAVLSAAAVDDASRRPSAAELAAAVFATGPAAPHPAHGRTSRRARPQLLTATRPPPPRSHRRRSGADPAQLLDAGRAAGRCRRCVGRCAVRAGLGRGRHRATLDRTWQRASRRRRTTTRPWRADGASVLVALDARRASAFAAVSPGRLADVYAAVARRCAATAPGCADLAATGLHVERLRMRPRSVRVVTSSPRRVVLDVVDALDPYDVRTARGALVDARPGRGAASWRVTLVREGGDWRVFDVAGTPSFPAYRARREARARTTGARR